MPTCPACNHDIPPTDVNVAEGVALCRPCDHLHRLSDLASSEPAPPSEAGARDRIDADTPVPEGPPDPVPGTSYRDDGMFVTITASPRNFKHALIGLLMCVLWNGLISAGLFAAWTRILVALGVALPWVPSGGAPASGFVADALKMPIGLAVFINVFMIPFLLVGLAMLAATLYAIAGRLEVVVTDIEGWVWRGVLVWGRKKRFDPMTVTHLGTRVKMERDSSGDVHVEKKIFIGLPEGKPIRFGSTLTDQRRQFVERALRYAVLSRRQTR